MPENSEGIGPTIMKEQKEKLGFDHFNLLIIPGEGPVKDIYFLSELRELSKTDPKAKEKLDKWQERWKTFTTEPERLKFQEDSQFFVVDDTPHGSGNEVDKQDRNPYFSTLEEIRNRTDIGEEEKKILIETKKLEFAGKGKFSQPRWGELNALAAGVALYENITDKIILTGGKTKPSDSLNKIADSARPSEAAVMKDIIISRFGKLLFEQKYPGQFTPEKYKQFLDNELSQRILVEDEALTTPENILYSVNKYPTLFKEGEKLGLLTNKHQLERATGFMRYFAGIQGEIGQLSSQELLEQRAKLRNKQYYADLMHFFYDDENNSDLTKRQKGDKEKAERLKEPAKIMYFFGFLGLHKDGARVQSLLNELRSRTDPNDPNLAKKWTKAISFAFNEAGLLYSDKPEDQNNPDNLFNTNFGELQISNPDKYSQIMDKVATLTAPGPNFRDKPVPPKLLK